MVKTVRRRQNIVAGRRRQGQETKVNQRLVTSVHDALKEDRRLTVRDLAEKFDMSVGTVHTILVEKEMSKVFHLI